MRNCNNFFSSPTNTANPLDTTPRANPFTFSETLDAGDTLATATSIGASSSASTLINGNIENNRDVDLFKINLAQSGSFTFDANPVGDPRLNINTFLFNEAGNPMSPFLEPVDADNMKFTVADLAAGNYFIAIGSDDLDAFDINNNRIAGNDTTDIMPNGVLDHWNFGDRESRGAYTIAITNDNPLSTPIDTPINIPSDNPVVEPPVLEVPIAPNTNPNPDTNPNPGTPSTFTETTDAGETLATAISTGNANLINGNIENNRDVDMFKINLATSGTYTFDANPVGDPRLNINTFLFNEAGNPMSPFLEPVDADNMKFTVDLAAGNYFLAIGSDDLDAFDANNNRIAGNDTTEITPNGVFDHWNDGERESRGAYTIAITNDTPNNPPVLEPTAPTLEPTAPTLEPTAPTTPTTDNRPKGRGSFSGKNHRHHDRPHKFGHGRRSGMTVDRFVQMESAS